MENRRHIIDGIRIISIVIFFILAVILIIQILRSVLGGSWSTEDIIVSLVLFNLVAILTLMGYMWRIDNKIGKHIGWHKGYDNGKRNSV